MEGFWWSDKNSGIQRDEETKWKNESRRAFLEAALHEETGEIKEEEANSQLVSPPVGKHGLSNCCFRGLL